MVKICESVIRKLMMFHRKPTRVSIVVENKREREINRRRERKRSIKKNNWKTSHQQDWP